MFGWWVGMALGIPQCWKVTRPGRCYRADTLSCCPAAACCSCCSARAARGLEGQSEAVHRARRRGQDGGRQASRIGPQAHGYRHRITYLSEHPEPANQLLPRVHLVTSLLKRWLLGTHQGAVSPAHLDSDLDEFTCPVQPPALTAPRDAVLPLGPAGWAGRPCAVHGHGQRRRARPLARPQDVGVT